MPGEELEERAPHPVTGILKVLFPAAGRRRLGRGPGAHRIVQPAHRGHHRPLAVAGEPGHGLPAAVVAAAQEVAEEPRAVAKVALGSGLDELVGGHGVRAHLLLAGAIAVRRLARPGPALGGQQRQRPADALAHHAIDPGEAVKTVGVLRLAQAAAQVVVVQRDPGLVQDQPLALLLDGLQRLFQEAHVVVVTAGPQWGDTGEPAGVDDLLGGGQPGLQVAADHVSGHLAAGPLPGHIGLVEELEIVHAALRVAVKGHKAVQSGQGGVVEGGDRPEVDVHDGRDARRDQALDQIVVYQQSGVVQPVPEDEPSHLQVHKAGQVLVHHGAPLAQGGEPVHAAAVIVSGPWVFQQVHAQTSSTSGREPWQQAARGSPGARSLSEGAPSVPRSLSGGW